MDEIIEAELASIIETDSEGYLRLLDDYKQRDLDGYELGKYSAGKDDLTREADFFRHEAISTLINNFPTYLPNSGGFRLCISSDEGKDRVTRQKWQQDVLVAINESGIDERALREALDSVHPSADIRFPILSYKTVNELIFPVYIKLREMGYTASELRR